MKINKFRNPEMVIRLCDTYGWDLESIYTALKEVSAPLSVIRPTISWWAGYHNQPISEDIANALGMTTYPTRVKKPFDRYRRKQTPYEEQPEDPLNRKLDDAVDKLTKVNVSKKLSEPEENYGAYEDPRVGIS